MNTEVENRKDSDSKRKIRDRYKGVDPSELEVIPGKDSIDIFEPTRILKVAAYVRVSTDNDEQTSSYELQRNEYISQIKSNPMWEFAGIYSDEGISGTQLVHRKGMLQMIEDSKAGKIDLILTKSIARFARNIIDCLSVIDELKKLDPPVGVKFEAENIYSLDSTGRLILTILASFAEEESHTKSIIMNWSIDKRFSKGIFLTPELLGYDLDEDKNLVINETEAETVTVIYNLLLNGYSLTEIGDILTEYRRKTKLGNIKWSPSSLRDIIGNERHCGDILARKTYTPDYISHKSVKNRNNITQYRQRDHHEAIVSRDVFDAANLILAANKYRSKNRPLPILSVVENGILKGFVPIDKDWTGFSPDDYIEASKSVSNDDVEKIEFKGRRLNLEGYQRVRAQFFSTRLDPAMTIKKGKMTFNTACLRKFEDVEYVELLLNSKEHLIAIRPCDKSNPNAIKWGKLKEGRWCTKSVSCRGLAKALFDILEWEEETSYRFRGQFIERNNQKVMMFELDEPEMEKIKEIVLPPVNDDEFNKDNADKDNGNIVNNTNVSTDSKAFDSSYIGDISNTNSSGSSNLELKDNNETKYDNTDDNSLNNDVKNSNIINDESENVSNEERIIIKQKVRCYPPSWLHTFGTPVSCVGSASILEQRKYSEDWDVLSPAVEIEEMNVFSEESLNDLLVEAQSLIEKWGEELLDMTEADQLDAVNDICENKSTYDQEGKDTFYL